MRFFLDENIPLAALDTLRAAYPSKLHQFEHVTDSDLAGTKDPQLFAHLAAEGYDALITEDRNQLKDHAIQLQASGVHWIGYRSKPSLSGVDAITTKTASVIAAMRHIVEAIEGATHQVVLVIHLVPLERSQRIKEIPSAHIARLAQAQQARGATSSLVAPSP